MNHSLNQDRWKDYLYILPMILVFCVFILYPVVQVIYQSFFIKSASGEMSWAGLGNYTKFFHSKEAKIVFKNTAIWCLIGTASKIVLGLIMAYILNKKFRGKKLLTVIILIPYAMPAAVSCTVWRLMYNPNFGHINQMLLDLHFINRAVSFLGKPATSLTAVMIVNIWAVAPFCALNILSSMYAIPAYIYEAAELDGANAWQQYMRITLPMIFTDVRTLALLIGLWAFNSFDVIYMMTTGGPANSSAILVNQVYSNAFEFNNRPYSAAISVVCFFILMIFAVLYVQSKGREESYE